MNFTQIVNFPTRGENIIDYVFTNDTEFISAKQPFGNSDHNSIKLNLNCENPTFYRPANNSHILFDFANGDYLNLNNFFLQIDWKSKLGNSKDLNIMYENFLHIVHEGIVKFIPLKAVNRKTFLPNHIVKLGKYKDQLFKNIHHPRVLLKYNKVCQDFQKQLNRYHCNLENKILSMPIKETYKYVKNKLKNKNASKVTNLTIDNVHLSDTLEIANAFHDH
jgi:hypothetical protein